MMKKVQNLVSDVVKKLYGITVKFFLQSLQILAGKVAQATTVFIHIFSDSLTIAF
jgi:hypothetical protein